MRDSRRRHSQVMRGEQGGKGRPKGWVALRLDIGKLDWSEVSELLLVSYQLLAPKRLASPVKSRA